MAARQGRKAPPKAQGMHWCEYCKTWVQPDAKVGNVDTSLLGTRIKQTARRAFSCTSKLDDISRQSLKFSWTNGKRNKTKNMKSASCCQH